MNNWENTLIDSSSSVENAINTLSSGGMRVVLVVDQEKKLLGTITDGDIRRALLNHVSLDTLAIKIMNHEPKVASIYEKSEALLSMMRKEDILHVPIVDDMNRIVGLEILQHFVKKKKFDNIIFLMAGGFGSRLNSLTKDTPKPLLRVGSRPILETILIQFIDAGFHNFYISTHYKAEMIRDYFGDGSSWGVSIQYIFEDVPLGTAGSLALLPVDLPDLPMIIMNSDLLTNIDFNYLLNFHDKKNGNATICVREYNSQIPYGVVEIKDHYVTKIIEKPVKKYFVSAGIYVIEKTLVKKLTQKSYLDMPVLLEKYIENGEQVNVFPIHEYWLDIGCLEEYEKANKEINI